jgi:radical SAM superfamily enzyme YgiQ (UPF0313 family)
MRVLLVNPPYPISETPSPPLSLALLGAALEKAGAVVEILDLAVVPYRESEIESILSRLSPQVAGVTCVTMTVKSALQIVRAIKRLAPEVLTVMGGPHVSFCAGNTLEQLPELDCICRGEGENSLVALCRAVADGDGFSAVPGLVWRNGGALVENSRSENPVDLDALPPPARHLLPLGRYRALGLPPSMITSRGCPFSCIFCVGRKMGGRRVRYRNPERVADEMAGLAGLGFHQINVADDLFTADADHCLRVCRSIGRRGLSISWTCFSRVDTVSERLLSALAGAGCHTVSFGVESADPGILKTVKKGIRPRQVLDAVSLCVDAGITPQISFILGLPGETRQTVEKTVAFAERLQQMGATFGFHLLAPFPGTEVRQRAAQYGLRILSDDWQTYDANRAVVETDSITAKELDRIVIGWEDKFDEYLGHLGRLRETGAAPAEDVWPLTRLEHTVVLYDLMMGRAIEENGTWRNGSGAVMPDAALEELIGRLKVPADASYGRDQLQKTLRFALSEGYLTVSSESGTIRWQWVDTLPHSP